MRKHHRLRRALLASGSVGIYKAQISARNKRARQTLIALPGHTGANGAVVGLCAGCERRVSALHSRSPRPVPRSSNQSQRPRFSLCRAIHVTAAYSRATKLSTPGAHAMCVYALLGHATASSKLRHADRCAMQQFVGNGA